MLAAPGGSPDERQVVTFQIRWPAGDGPPAQDFIQYLGRHRGGLWHGQRRPPEGVGQVQAMHPGLDQPGGTNSSSRIGPKKPGPMVSGAWSTMYW